jgi:hypothetical protein
MYRGFCLLYAFVKERVKRAYFPCITVTKSCSEKRKKKQQRFSPSEVLQARFTVKLGCDYVCFLRDDDVCSSRLGLGFIPAQALV